MTTVSRTSRMGRTSRMRPPDGADVRTVLPARLIETLEATAPMVVAFSGGVDSTFLAVAATELLGRERVRVVTAASPSLAADELERCERLATDWGLDWETVSTDEFADERYLANDVDRCYWCKSHLMDALTPIAAGATVVLGVNTDDLGDHRPGQAAARERGARFPLVDAGLSKAEIRRLSQQLGLETWDRPASPCLSSRLPYGTPVTLGRLSAVELAERALHRLGFVEVRVRHHGDVGLVEVNPSQLDEAVRRRAAIVRAVRDAGFRYVALDLEGFESGRLNRAHRAADTGRRDRL